jgi:hypothetical protein
MRNQIREDQIRHDTQIKAIADFLKKVLPWQKKQPQQQSKRVSFKTEPLSEGEKHTSPATKRLEFEPSPETVHESLLLLPVRLKTYFTRRRKVVLLLPKLKVTTATLMGHPKLRNTFAKLAENISAK